MYKICSFLFSVLSAEQIHAILKMPEEDAECLLFAVSSVQSTESSIISEGNIRVFHNIKVILKKKLLVEFTSKSSSYEGRCNVRETKWRRLQCLIWMHYVVHIQHGPQLTVGPYWIDTTYIWWKTLLFSYRLHKF